MKKIIVNTTPWEDRVAILDEENLEKIYFGESTNKYLERSFFKGKIIKVLPGLQTVFIDIGEEKAGFLHISEIDKNLIMNKESGLSQLDIIKTETKNSFQKSDLNKIKVKDIFSENETLLVQVSKEPFSGKGAKLSTCFTLPGRFVVLMPNINQMAISKKISNKDERDRLKNIISKYLPASMSAIIRTCAEGVDDKDIKKDINFLIKEWEDILTNFSAKNSVGKIYEDLAISLQVVRDHLNAEVEEIVTDNKENQQMIYNYLKKVAPAYKHKVKFYKNNINIFEYFNIENQIKDALLKTVYLKSGAYIVIETTEAMTVIDVNTGKFTGSSDFSKTILRTNIEAAEAIVRQLKLRNIGGLIVIDFIDMSNFEDRAKLIDFFNKKFKELDNFQSVVLNVSEFGLVQITRKRSGKTLLQQLSDKCFECYGTGYLRSVRSQSYEILNLAKRELDFIKERKNNKFIFYVNPKIFDFISSVEYDAIIKLENLFKCSIIFQSNKDFKINQFKIEKD